MAYKLSVVIPCYNEKATIGAILDAVRRAPIPDIEIIVVNDASSDGSRRLLDGTLRDKMDVLIHHEVNQGKGAALRSGIQDANLEYDPQDYPKVLKPLLDRKADVVFGSRFTSSESHRVLYYWHAVGNRFLTTLCNMFSDLNLSDM